MKNFAYLNGQFLESHDASISITDRGFTLGDGIFETMLWQAHHVFRLEDHFTRLQHAAVLTQLHVPLHVEQLKALIEELIEKNGLTEKAAAVRLTITRGTTDRGIMIPAQTSPTIALTASALPQTSHAPTTLTTVSTRRNEFSLISSIKSLNYLDNVLARHEATQKEAKEALMLNIQGHLACTPIANLFFVKQRKVYTPSLDCGILPGITRKVVLELCQAHHIPYEEGVFTLDDILNADEVFLTNSLIGLQKVNQINHHALSSITPITDHLHEFYEQALFEGTPTL